MLLKVGIDRVRPTGEIGQQSHVIGLAIEQDLRKPQNQAAEALSATSLSRRVQGSRLATRLIRSATTAIRSGNLLYSIFFYPGNL
jgi:hypothetical protein